MLEKLARKPLFLISVAVSINFLIYWTFTVHTWSEFRQLLIRKSLSSLEKLLEQESFREIREEKFKRKRISPLKFHENLTLKLWFVLWGGQQEKEEPRLLYFLGNTCLIQRFLLNLSTNSYSSCFFPYADTSSLIADWLQDSHGPPSSLDMIWAFRCSQRRCLHQHLYVKGSTCNPLQRLSALPHC